MIPRVIRVEIASEGDPGGERFHAAARAVLGFYGGTAHAGEPGYAAVEFDPRTVSGGIARVLAWAAELPEAVVSVSYWADRP